jgi:hypothetical protein
MVSLTIPIHVCFGVIVVGKWAKSCGSNSVLSSYLRVVDGIKSRGFGPPGHNCGGQPASRLSTLTISGLASAAHFPHIRRQASAASGKEGSSTKLDTAETASTTFRIITKLTLESAAQNLHYDLSHSSCAITVASICNPAIDCCTTVRDPHWIGNLELCTATKEEGCHSIQR